NGGASKSANDNKAQAHQIEMTGSGVLTAVGQYLKAVADEEDRLITDRKYRAVAIKRKPELLSSLNLDRHENLQHLIGPASP
ncbi:unnamed protein product, partial [Amoebophrya sp. A25]